MEKLQADEVVDAAGNVVKVVKQLTDAEKKKIAKEKAKRRKIKEKARSRGENVSSDSTDWDEITEAAKS